MSPDRAGDLAAELARERRARRAAERDAERAVRDGQERERALGEAVKRGRRLLAEALVAEDRDRARIVQLLHDYALQSLLTARQDLEEGLEGDPEGLRQAQRGLLIAIAQIREILADMHPVAVDHAGLATALRSVAADAAGAAGAQLAIDVPELPDTGFDVLVLAVARELLTNAERHANPTRLELRVALEQDSLRLIVADDGAGFVRRPTQALRRGHIGLAAAGERVAAMGGRLDVVSAPGEGTTVTVTLPL